MAVDVAMDAWQQVVHRILTYGLAINGLLCLTHYVYSLNFGPFTTDTAKFLRAGIRTGYNNSSTDSIEATDYRLATGGDSDQPVPANKVLLGSWEDVKAIEAVYLRSRRKAEAVLAEPVDRTIEAYLTDAAFYPCPLKERLGDIYDGGKWLCAVDALINSKADCVVYSLGSAGEVGFEMDVVERMPKCRIFVFDPSLDEQKRAAVAAIPGVTFHDVGIASATSDERVIADYVDSSHVVKTVDLLTAMREDGVDWVDVLKMDIETYEFEVMEPMFEQGVKLPCTFFLVELHTPPYDQVTNDEKRDRLLRFFKGMRDMGFRVFVEEPNLFAEAFTAASNIVEMGFINVDAEGLVLVGPEVAPAT